MLATSSNLVAIELAVLASLHACCEQRSSLLCFQEEILADDGRSVRRVGVGVHVLSLSDIDLRSGKFYADLQVPSHQSDLRSTLIKT